MSGHGVLGDSNACGLASCGVKCLVAATTSPLRTRDASVYVAGNFYLHVTGPLRQCHLGGLVPCVRGGEREMERGALP
jgi:hypothetical protein